MKVVVLPDGTWEMARSVELWDITEEALQKILDGDDVRRLPDEDVLSVYQVD
jgi:hypothetical protein